MASDQTRTHKHFRLNEAKIRRAQKVLRVKTETEAIEQALDLLLSEHKRNRIAARASERFVASGVVIKDIYSNLEP